MKNMQTTPEPFCIVPGEELDQIIDACGAMVFEISILPFGGEENGFRKDTADRIVTCTNSLAALPTEYLKTHKLVGDVNTGFSVRKSLRGGL